MTRLRLLARIAAGPLRALLAAGTAGALLGGCGTATTYDGPELPEEEVAVLEGYWRYYLLAMRIVQITKVDGKPALATSPVTRVMLSAGRHSVELQVGTILGEAGLTTRCSFAAQFERGHRYRIRSFDDSVDGDDITIEVQALYHDSATTRTIPCRRVDR